MACVITMAKESVVLKTDYFTVPGQRYALLSVIGPNSAQASDNWGLKIRGAFNTKEEATEHVKELMQTDPHFDVYMVDMYKWLAFPPNREEIKDVHYQEEFLENMVQGYMENHKKARALFEERKEAVMRDGLDKHLLPEERLAPLLENVHPAEQAGPSTSSS